MNIYSEVLIKVTLAVENQWFNTIYFLITYIPIRGGDSLWDVSVPHYHSTKQTHKCFIFDTGFQKVP